MSSFDNAIACRLYNLASPKDERGQRPFVPFSSVSALSRHVGLSDAHLKKHLQSRDRFYSQRLNGEFAARYAQ